jgi:hypothetical protein
MKSVRPVPALQGSHCLVVVDPSLSIRRYRSTTIISSSLHLVRIIRRAGARACLGCSCMVRGLDVGDPREGSRVTGRSPRESSATTTVAQSKRRHTQPDHRDHCCGCVRAGTRLCRSPMHTEAEAQLALSGQCCCQLPTCDVTTGPPNRRCCEANEAVDDVVSVMYPITSNTSGSISSG